MKLFTIAGPYHSFAYVMRLLGGGQNKPSGGLGSCQIVLFVIPAMLT